MPIWLVYVFALVFPLVTGCEFFPSGKKVSLHRYSSKLKGSPNPSPTPSSTQTPSPSTSPSPSQSPNPSPSPTPGSFSGSNLEEWRLRDNKNYPFSGKIGELILDNPVSSTAKATFIDAVSAPDGSTYVQYLAKDYYAGTTHSQVVRKYDPSGTLVTGWGDYTVDPGYGENKMLVPQTGDLILAGWQYYYSPIIAKFSQSSGKLSYPRQDLFPLAPMAGHTEHRYIFSITQSKTGDYYLLEYTDSHLSTDRFISLKKYDSAFNPLNTLDSQKLTTTISNDALSGSVSSDAAGNIYYFDFPNRRIKKYTSDVLVTNYGASAVDLAGLNVSNIRYAVDSKGKVILAFIGTLTTCTPPCYEQIWTKSYGADGTEIKDAFNKQQVASNASAKVALADMQVNSDDSVYLSYYSPNGSVTPSSSPQPYELTVKRFHTDGTEDLINWNKAVGTTYINPSGDPFKPKLLTTPSGKIGVVNNNGIDFYSANGIKTSTLPLELSYPIKVNSSDYTTFQNGYLRKDASLTALKDIGPTGFTLASLTLNAVQSSLKILYNVGNSRVQIRGFGNDGSTYIHLAATTMPLTERVLRINSTGSILWDVTLNNGISSTDVHVNSDGAFCFAYYDTQTQKINLTKIDPNGAMTNTIFSNPDKVRLAKRFHLSNGGLASLDDETPLLVPSGTPIPRVTLSTFDASGTLSWQKTVLGDRYRIFIRELPDGSILLAKGGLPEGLIVFNKFKISDGSVMADLDGKSYSFTDPDTYTYWSTSAPSLITTDSSGRIYLSLQVATKREGFGFSDMVLVRLNSMGVEDMNWRKHYKSSNFLYNPAMLSGLSINGNKLNVYGVGNNLLDIQSGMRNWIQVFSTD